MRRKLNRLFRDLLADNRYLLLGQSIRDPYGGASKVTRGLSTAFDTQVINCPISESAMIGISTGLAMRGFRPITEIMFSDFMTLCTDQLFNVAVKLRDLHEIELNITIRTMQGMPDYGPTHSQDMDWLQIPGVNYHRNDIDAYSLGGINVITENRESYENSDNWSG